MELEKEISIKEFDNNYHKVVINIFYTQGWILNRLKEEMDPFNLTNQQYHILRILQKLHPNSASINLLKENMIDKMSDVSRIVDRLLQKDLLARNVSNKDRRSVDITITQKGLELLKEINLDNSLRGLLESNLTSEEAGELSRLLDKFRG